MMQIRWGCVFFFMMKLLFELSHALGHILEVIRQACDISADFGKIVPQDITPVILR